MVKDCKTCKHQSCNAEIYPCRNCAENNRDGYEPKQDLTKMKTTKAFRSDGNVRDFRFTDTAYCPYCEAENDNLIIVRKEGDCTIVKNSCQYDTDEANAMMFECKCWSCGDTFRVDYFKEV